MAVPWWQRIGSCAAAASPRRKASTKPAGVAAAAGFAERRCDGAPAADRRPGRPSAQRAAGRPTGLLASRRRWRQAAKRRRWQLQRQATRSSTSVCGEDGSTVSLPPSPRLDPSSAAGPEALLTRPSLSLFLSLPLPSSFSLSGRGRRPTPSSAARGRRHSPTGPADAASGCSVPT